MKKIVCDECLKRQKELDRLGYSVSTSSSMVSSVEEVVLCEVCGKQMNKHNLTQQPQNDNR